MDRIYVMQLVRSFQVGQISRRVFLQRASVALGGMAAANMLLAACTPVTREGAVRPVTEATPTGEGVGSAETNLTTEEGLIAEMVEYPGPDGAMLPGYLARPDDGAAHPGLIVLQEWWGLNEHIKDVTRRFAQQGYVVLAPDLYKGVVATEPDEARKLVMELDMPNAVAEIGSGADFLLGQDYVSGDQVGITGFCMGGRLTLMAALNDAGTGRYAVAIPFYGSPLTPDEAAQVTTPILGLYGADDGGIPVAEVEAMGAALTAAGVDNQIIVYPGAPHSFFNDTRESYRPEAAADAWQQALAWLQKYLGA
jgi:carboxymethylenebutenolidase